MVKIKKDKGNHEWRKFLKKLQQKDYVVYEFLKKHRIKQVQKVQNYYAEKWYEAITDKNVRVKIHKPLFDAYEDLQVKDIVYVN